MSATSWSGARPNELVLAAEADKAVSEDQFFERLLSPADWTLEDVRAEEDVELGGES